MDTNKKITDEEANLREELAKEKKTVRRIKPGGAFADYTFAELSLVALKENPDLVIHGDVILDLCLHLVARPEKPIEVTHESFFGHVLETQTFQVLDPDSLRLQIQLRERERTGWDNPISEHGGQLLWVVKSSTTKPTGQSRCFGCGNELGEAITLSFGYEGPWTFCRKCVTEAAEAFRFVAEADW